MNSLQFRELIVDPVLHAMNMWTQEASDLLMGTAAQESSLGFYVKQVDGPALGPYGMERLAHDDMWNRWLPMNMTFGNTILNVCKLQGRPLFEQLMTDLLYSTAMCRIYYRSIPDPIPKTLDGQAAYYKKWYNTATGKASTDEYIANYNYHVLGMTHGNQIKPTKRKG